MQRARPSTAQAVHSRARPDGALITPHREPATTGSLTLRDGSRYPGPSLFHIPRSARMDCRNDPIVASTAEGSYPQCAMQLAHLGSLPLP